MYLKQGDFVQFCLNKYRPHDHPDEIPFLFGFSLKEVKYRTSTTMIFSTETDKIITRDGDRFNLVLPIDNEPRVKLPKEWLLDNTLYKDRPFVETED